MVAQKFTFFGTFTKLSKDRLLPSGCKPPGGIPYWCARSKQKVEIDRKSPSPMTEKIAVSRVGDVVMDHLGVEMVGQVEPDQTEADRIFGIELNILGQTRIHTEEARISLGI